VSSTVRLRANDNSVTEYSGALGAVLVFSLSDKEFVLLAMVCLLCVSCFHATRPVQNAKAWFIEMGEG
jgi:hypothetical protein